MPNSRSIISRWVLASVLTIALLSAETRFHHLHLLATDPDAAREFYAKRFRDPDAYLKIERVATPPRTDGYSTLWHFGWGAPDFRAEYQRQLDLGTHISHEVEELLPNFFYAYLAAPHGVEVEINTARTDAFIHVHLQSPDPIAAAEWYVKVLGLKPQRPVERKPVRIGKYLLEQGAAFLDLGRGGPQLLIFPKLDDGAKNVQPMHGRAVDHLAFAVDSIEETRARARAAGLPMLDGAFIEGPDRARIELLPNH